MRQGLILETLPGIAAFHSLAGSNLLNLWRIY
jgi:hypothetical protein